MKLLTGKIVLGATLAISLGAFTLPASASMAPNAQSSATRKDIGVRYAQVEQKIDEKANEVKSEATGAKNAVVAVHRRHERNESRPHTIGGKVGSKVDEVNNEAKGAGNAVERAHDQHETTEHAEDRN
jgi:hypothetical protein